MRHTLSLAMSARVIGLICSVSRIGAVGTAVLGAFLLLTPDAFIRFAQFHAETSLATWLACLAVVERSSLYRGCAFDRETQRNAFIKAMTLLGWSLAALGTSLSILSSTTAAISLGAGASLLAVPEAAALRDKHVEAGRAELIGYGALVAIALAIASARWFELSAFTFLLGLSLVIPRLATSLVIARRISWGGSITPAAGVVSGALHTIARFTLLQAALPFVYLAPAYLMPSFLPVKQTAWFLLAQRASGVVSAAAGRIFVQVWIAEADRVNPPTHVTKPKTTSIALGLFTATLLIAAWLLPDALAIAVFALFAGFIFLAIGVFSTQLNARSIFLHQLLPFSLTWGASSVLLWYLAKTSSGQLQLSMTVITYALFMALALLWFRYLEASSRANTTSSSIEQASI